MRVSNLRRVVIVGGGLAGHRTATALRKHGFEGKLVVIGDEPHLPYDRPPLSKQLLQGTLTDDAAFFPTDELGASWLLGSRAVALDVERHVVELANGAQEHYDAAVIATGRRAREWPHQLPAEGFHTLRSLDDCRALKRAIAPGCRVAIVGAGFIGCEVAATLRALGVESVTLLDVADLPLAPLGRAAGERAAQLHVDHGVELRLGVTITGFTGEGRVRAVELAGADPVAADVVLLALGSEPNTEWLEGSLELVRGAVSCDENLLAAGTEDVFAAGDVAAFPHPLLDGRVCVEHWTNAREMASLVAGNILGPADAQRPFTTVPTFWSDQFDVKIKSVGYIGLADTFEVVDEIPEKRALVVEARRDGELVGAITFNRNKRMIEYTRELGSAAAAA
jgi:NADPH-dependent 2,4-dienoyl-CoA reductase/sulfur reductase-like enzyme